MRDPENIPLTNNAMTVLKRRYLARDGRDNIVESPREMFVRIARFIAQADRNYGADDRLVAATESKFYRLMASLDFLPNSPTLMNAGRPLGQLSACFVLPVGDSMEEIFETNMHAALIHKSGGGTGFSFSRLRPKNSVVASTNGVASGPVSFMKVYDSSTEAVKQGGTRRGANMGILRVDHPDIMEFISCKANVGDITNFNISVAVTDVFMKALERGEDYPLIDPRTGETYRDANDQEVHLSAPEVFETIIKQAWATGEPGVVFIDRMNRLNPTSPSEIIEATNPCGEQPLPPYDSCNLGSINVGHFVVSELPGDYSSEHPEDGVDWDRLKKTVHEAVHFLDNVIDQNKYPLPQIEAQSRKNRRIGLGVMGWSDLLVRLNVPYNAPQALELADKLMSFVEAEAQTASSDLATTRGRFPNWEGSVYADQDVAMRNATVTTIAPTGTLSIIAGCSSGIEPYYSIAFERRVLDGTVMKEVAPTFAEVMTERGLLNDELIDRVIQKRSLTEIPEIPEDVQQLFLTAADISPEDHVRMQAAFQKHSDSSVSKTINFPENASVDSVAEAFKLAWEAGCKGITVYRDNARPDQVLSSRRADSGHSKAVVESRPDLLTGFTEKVQTGYGNLYVTVNSKDGRPFEVFAQIGKSGYSTMADTEAICRLISMLLRSGVEASAVIEQLRGIGGASPVFSKDGKISSIPDAIAQVLQRRFGDPKGAVSGEVSVDICPSCSGKMRFESGCYHCPSCGYSSC